MFQSVIFAPAYHGDLRGFYSAVHIRSLILVILVIRGDFVSVCVFVSVVLKCPQKVGLVKHYPVWLISLYFTGLIPFNLDLILLLL
jgi:hypothetical protein